MAVPGDRGLVSAESVEPAGVLAVEERWCGGAAQAGATAAEPVSLGLAA